MNTSKQILLYFSFILGSSLSTLSQEAQERPAPTTPKSNGPTYCVTSWGDWKGVELFAKDRDKKIKFEINDLSLSAPINYKRDEGITLYKEVNNPEKDKLELVPAVNVAIPASIQKPLIVLFPSANDQIKYMVFELSPAGFPPSSYRFVNMTKVPIQIAINDKPYIVKPGEDSMVKRAIKKRVAVKLSASILDSNRQKKVVFSSAAMNRPNKRMTMFFFPSKDKNGHMVMSCRSLVDFVEP